MATFEVVPGRMDTLSVAMSCLGVSSIVDPGVWPYPFYVDCSDDDAKALEDILREAMTAADDREAKYVAVRKV